jgi:catechol 2,3-dioxygenase-like lactoylglutathione lyase family enzyme
VKIISFKFFCFLILFAQLCGKESNFSTQTIDLGIVVSDIEKSLKFYKDVIGFQEIDGFKVSGNFPKLVGLTDGAELNIHVLVLGDEESATKLKLMQVSSKKKSRIINQPYIHTLTGFSYLTIFVDNVDKVMECAEKSGYEAYAKSPQILPDGLPQDICLLMLKDPDGNFVEIVGPLTKELSK